MLNIECELCENEKRAPWGLYYAYVWPTLVREVQIIIQTDLLEGYDI